jgi:ferric-dicitrate binding protein FerR (iron transport regulator)
MSPQRKPTLDDRVREAREAPTPEVDWQKVEASLFPRIEREAAASAARARFGAGQGRAWTAVAAAMAIAASVPLFFASAPQTSFENAHAVDVARALMGENAGENGAEKAGALDWKDRSATVRVTREGVVREASVGDPILRGDTFEVHGGKAVFARREPDVGSVDWDLEDSAEVSVRATRGTLILALEKGAVEAQVTPVPAGEAFAVDVDDVRVAVHGTRLRVERQGSHAVVDLREGVVSIGLPPKVGSTYGDLVTAPAHIEFDTSDPHGTLKVVHDLGRVRAATSLQRPADDAERARPARTPPPPPPAQVMSPKPSAAAASPAVKVAAPATVPPLSAASSASAASAAATARATVNPPLQPPPEPAEADVNPEHTITMQVRACARDHLGQREGVVVTVVSRLEVTVGDSGMVTAARFDPPLAPDVITCSARAIYGTRFPKAGTVAIPIDVTP